MFRWALNSSMDYDLVRPQVVFLGILTHIDHRLILVKLSCFSPWCFLVYSYLFALASVVVVPLGYLKIPMSERLSFRPGFPFSFRASVWVCGWFPQLK